MKAHISGIVDVVALEAPPVGGSPPQPSHPIYNPPYPSHPIAPGGQPPGYWGGVAPPWPTHPIAPGGPPPQPSHPIYNPPYPAHPIAPGGGPPLGIWGGGVPMPTPPIYIPIMPPPDSGLSPEHPIYVPIDPSDPHPAHPIAGLSPEVVAKIKAFLYGNLPPQPPIAQPVE